MPGTLKLLPALAALLGSAQVLAGGLLETTIQKWREYEEDCQRRMGSDPALDTEVYCRRMFDGYVCWPDAVPGRIVKVPCPPYLPWSEQVSSGHAHRKCTENGTWLSHQANSSVIWRDVSECEEGEAAIQEKEVLRMYFQSLQTAYTVGYSFSLVLLSVAVAILASFRRLRDLRHQIHLHLFVSFMLRAVSVLVKDAILHQHYWVTLDPGHDWSEVHPDKVAVACRLAQVFLHYCSGCSYCWLLVEGLYLHALLFCSALAQEACLNYYCLFGWGSPVLVVAMWVCGKYLLDNDGCWSENSHLGIWWIIRVPIGAIVVVNFLIFLRVLLHLGCSHRRRQPRLSDSKCQLAKATLFLLPLLSVHEILYVLLPDEVPTGGARGFLLFIVLILTSFQGCLLSILYCFAAHEVQRELKDFWWRLRRKRLGGEDGSPSASVVTFVTGSEPARMYPVASSLAQSHPTENQVKLGLVSDQDHNHVTSGDTQSTMG